MGAAGIDGQDTQGMLCQPTELTSTDATSYHDQGCVEKRSPRPARETGKKRSHRRYRLQTMSDYRGPYCTCVVRDDVIPRVSRSSIGRSQTPGNGKGSVWDGNEVQRPCWLSSVQVSNGFIYTALGACSRTKVIDTSPEPEGRFVRDDLSEKSSNHRLLVWSLVRCPKILLKGRHSSRVPTCPSRVCTGRNESERTYSITDHSVQVLDNACMASLSSSHEKRSVRVSYERQDSHAHLLRGTTTDLRRLHSDLVLLPAVAVSSAPHRCMDVVVRTLRLVLRGYRWFRRDVSLRRRPSFRFVLLSVWDASLSMATSSFVRRSLSARRGGGRNPQVRRGCLSRILSHHVRDACDPSGLKDYLAIIGFLATTLARASFPIRVRPCAHHGMPGPFSFLPLPMRGIRPRTCACRAAAAADVVAWKRSGNVCAMDRRGRPSFHPRDVVEQTKKRPPHASHHKRQKSHFTRKVE